jgi:hypothetical protein
MAQKEQNYRNHTRIDPWFHIFLFFGSLIRLGASVYALIRRFELWGIVRIFGAVWLIVLMFKTRLYALKVQDRVIRLEERLRLERLLPDHLRPRIGELTEGQLIALRFASDAELPALVEKTLAGNFDPQTIKKTVQQWRPDYLRV